MDMKKMIDKLLWCDIYINVYIFLRLHAAKTIFPTFRIIMDATSHIFQ